MTTAAYEALAAKLVEVTAERDRPRTNAAALEQEIDLTRQHLTSLRSAWRIVGGLDITRPALRFLYASHADSLTEVLGEDQP